MTPEVRGRVTPVQLTDAWSSAAKSTGPPEATGDPTVLSPGPDILVLQSRFLIGYTPDPQKSPTVAVTCSLVYQNERWLIADVPKIEKGAGRQTP